MMKSSSILAYSLAGGAALFSLSKADSPPEPSLVASSVATYEPDDVGINIWGVYYAHEDKVIPGSNYVIEAKHKSEIQFLGCDFEMEPRYSDAVFEAAADALNKVANSTPTTSHGYLVKPKRSGDLANPTIEVACDDSRSYYYFTYRNSVGPFGNFGHKTIIVEYEKSRFDPFSNPDSWMNAGLNRSQKASLLTTSMEAMYVVPFIEPENKERAKQEEKMIIDFVVDAIPTLFGAL